MMVVDLPKSFTIINNKEEISFISNDLDYSIDLHKINLKIRKSNPKLDYKIKKRYYGILGLIESKEFDYLILIKGVSKVCEILNAPIFKVTELEFIPMTVNQPDELYLLEDQEYIQMINSFILDNNLYFSEKYDLTNSIENNLKKKQSTVSFTSILKEYTWNMEISLNLLKELSNFQRYCINGYINSEKFQIENKEFQFTLISRKLKTRSGMKYYSSGIDEDGNSSNHVETEQILIYYEKNPDSIKVLSFNQVRGSLPLIWFQEPNLMKPKVTVQVDKTINSNSLVKHVRYLKNKFQNVLLLSLLSPKENLEKSLKKLIETSSKKNEILYYNFDFHEVSKHYLMGYKNLHKLFYEENFTNNLFDFGFNHFKINSEFKFDNEEDPKLEVISNQKGVIRTNCFSCADRTNITQFMISSKTSHLMLNKCLSKKLERISNVIEYNFENNYFDKINRKFWLENGDKLCNSYVGPRAFFSEIVGKGRRTFYGIINDLKSTLIRYISNHFYDGYKQDCNDFFLGKLKPRLEKLQRHYFFLPYLVLIYFISLNYYLNSRAIFYFQDYFSNISVAGYVFVFISVTILNFLLNVSLFKEFVIDKPSLNKSKPKNLF